MGAEARQKETRIEAHGVTLLRDRLATGALDALAVFVYCCFEIHGRDNLGQFKTGRYGKH